MWLWFLLLPSVAADSVQLPNSETQIIFDEDPSAALAVAMQNMNEANYVDAAAGFEALADASPRRGLRLLEALAWYEAGNLRKCEIAVERAQGDPRTAGDVMALMGLVYADKGQGTQALRELDRAESNARSSENQILMARIALNRAQIYMDEGTLDAAQRELSRAKQLGESHGAADIVHVARANLARLDARLNGGNGPASVDLVSARLRAGDVAGARAAIPPETPQDRRTLVRSKLSTGLVLRAESDHARASVVLREALALAREGGLVRETAAIIAELGTLFRLSGQFESALVHFQEAIGLVASTSMRVQEVAYRVEAARVATRLKELDQAENQLMVARRRAGGHDRELQLARISEVNGLIFEQRGDSTAADRAFQEASTTYAQASQWADEARVQTYRVSLWAGVDSNQQAKAEQAAAKAFGRFDERLGPAHIAVARGLGLARHGQLSEAVDAFLSGANLALASGMPSGRRVALRARENAAEAMTAMGLTSPGASAGPRDEALEAVASRQRAFKAGEAAYGRGKDDYNTGKYESAEAHFDEAVSAFQQIGDQGYLDTARRSRGWSRLMLGRSAPSARGLQLLEAAERDGLDCGDESLRIKARFAAAMVSRDLGLPNHVQRMVAAADLAEAGGEQDIAGQAFAMLAELATELPSRVRAARRSATLLGPEHPAAAYAMYSVAVDAHNQGDSRLAAELAREVLPVGGALTGAIKAVLEAAEAANNVESE